MYSKINLGELMDRQPGEGSGAGEEPVPDPGLPGGPAPGPGPSPSAEGSAASGPGGAASDPGLAGFVKGGMWDSAVPSVSLAAALEAAAGAGWRCEGGSRAEIVGAVRAAAALESRACAAKLGLIRAAIRQDDDGLGGGYHGDLPDEWSKSLTSDVALALAMSPVSAERLMQTAWDLGALLPGIGALLEDGTLTYAKARVVNDTLELLSEPGKAAAEAMIAPRVAGKTYGQVEKIAARAAITVDPDLAERTREHAERNRARVVLKRERSGAASLLGCDLPPAETLAAHAATCARARAYQDSGAFPGVLTDQFRAMAYLDLLNDIPAEARIAAGPPKEGLGAPAEAAFRDEPEPDDPGAPAPAGSGGSDCPCHECDGRCAPPDDADDDAADDDGPDGAGPDTGRGREDGQTRGSGWPGERPSPAPPPPQQSQRRAPLPGAPDPPLTALPARLNLTITATRLTELLRDPRLPGRPATPGSTPPTGWALSPPAATADKHAPPRFPDQHLKPGDPDRHSPPGDPPWCGTWIITLPSGLQYRVPLEPVPTHACDHRRESHAYEASDMLRHLVQIRDGECTLPTCSRHAKDSDFEHAIPYDQGGRTCACNAGARSHACHQVKQAPGWKVTQPKPGWHRWETPSGRTYTQEPKRYPT